MFRQTLLTVANNPVVSQTITHYGVSNGFALRFVAGERLEDAIRVIRNLNAEGMTATLDNLGENVTNEQEADKAAKRYLVDLDRIKSEGLRSTISVKLTQMGLDLGEDLCLANVRRILQRAKEYNIFVRFDMESSAYTARTLQIARNMRASGYPNCGVVIQAYLYRSDADVTMLMKEGMQIRLCKGAYQEPPSVAYQRKKEVDANYVLLMERLLLHGNYPALATHDTRIIEHAKEFAHRHQIGPERFEFQMLYGVRPALQRRLVAEGYNMRIYVPYGHDWYRYFVRRLAERPANLIFVLRNLLRA